MNNATSFPGTKDHDKGVTTALFYRKDGRTRAEQRDMLCSTGTGPGCRNTNPQRVESCSDDQLLLFHRDVSSLPMQVTPSTQWCMWDSGKQYDSNGGLLLFFATYEVELKGVS